MAGRSAVDGGQRELLQLAWPFILSNSFYTLQILLDRVMLSRHDADAVGAAMAAAMVFWTAISLLQNTANYATTFVAQYLGAGQPRRVGPVVWQALWFSLLGGMLILALAPLAGPLVALGGHEPRLQALETTYLRCLAYSGLPFLVSASVGSFFAGRGASRTVLVINVTGLAVNGLTAWLAIFGRPELGIPALGIAGAGWATVVGSATSAVLGLCLMLRPRFRTEYATAAGWRFDAPLFGRLLRFGLPNGLGSALDPLVFSFFILFVGRIGPAALDATSVTFTLNMLVILPTLGIGQAVEVLVGRRLGEDRPAIAARSAWTGLRVALVFTATLALVFLVLPGPLIALFEGAEIQDANRTEVRQLVPVLLRFVVVYCLFDAANLVFSFALRGAGDTRFVTLAALVFSWPSLVLPTWAAVEFGWGLYWAWSFASLYIMLLALTFLFRFLQGKWQSMRVIEMRAGAPPLLPLGTPSTNGSCDEAGAAAALDDRSARP